MSAVADDVFAPLMAELLEACKGMLWESYYPEEGPFARHLFPKHMAYIAATKDYNYCNLFGANRSSKSVLLSYIFSCWATGRYKDWWNGRRFDKPPVLWVAGQTSDLVKETWVRYMVGDNCSGGMIPQGMIESKHYVQGNLQSVLVRHPAGLSRINFKTYDQGWQRFQSGTADAVGFDEEMDPKIYSEAVTRVGTTNGLVLAAFTALKGITPLVAHLWPEGVKATEGPRGDEEDPQKHFRYTTFIGWKDIPYSLLSEQRRKEMIAQYPANEIKARTEGIPHIGSGMVYPIGEDSITVEPFEIPKAWPRAFALDPGYRGKTAGLWFAWDEDSDTIYAYSEHYVGMAEPATHIDAFRRRPQGKFIPCIIDPAGANVNDGKRTKQFYVEAMTAINPEWQIHDAQKSITTGIMEVWGRMTSGRFKVFSTCRNWLTEFRQYHRDDEGKIAPTPDHLMDCTRYGCLGVRHFRNAYIQNPLKKGQAGFIPDHWG